jgi:hypothetical protein
MTTVETGVLLGLALLLVSVSAAYWIAGGKKWDRAREFVGEGRELLAQINESSEKLHAEIDKAEEGMATLVRDSFREQVKALVNRQLITEFGWQVEIGQLFVLAQFAADLGMKQAASGVWDMIDDVLVREDVTLELDPRKVFDERDIRGAFASVGDDEKGVADTAADPGSCCCPADCSCGDSVCSDAGDSGSRPVGDRV